MYLCLSDGIFLLSSVTSWKEGGEKRERRNSKEREEWEGHRWQGKIITTLKMGYRHRKENGRGKAQGEMPNSQGIKRKGKKWRWQGGCQDHVIIHWSALGRTTGPGLHTLDSLESSGLAEAPYPTSVHTGSCSPSPCSILSLPTSFPTGQWCYLLHMLSSCTKM